MINYFILATTRQVPNPQQIAERVRQAGYDAVLENLGGHARTGLAAEIRYLPERLPIVIHIYHDMIDDPDEADYEYEEWLKELVTDENVRSKIRRWIFVDAFDNVDAAALQIVIDFIQVETEGIAILKN